MSTCRDCGRPFIPDRDSFGLCPLCQDASDKELTGRDY